MDLQHEIGRLVNQIWGYETLRPLQLEAVQAGLNGRDSLVVLPTGGGKSICYQVPPLLGKRTDIVVSPLISLMKDQVDGLKLVGYPAEAIHSGMDPSAQRQVFQEASAHRYRLLFVSPERVLTDGFLGLARQLKIGSFAIDEAHCISHWGHDFRQDYRRLAVLRQEFPDAALHAFTATATPRVREDIVSQLGLRDPLELIGQFDRPNLIYRILPKTDIKRRVWEVVVRHPNEAVIVYCLSRDDTESVASFLRQQGFDAQAYHAGLSSEERTRIQEAFATEKLNVVTATVAFGMGIDRSNVRCIVHASMPKSIEQYQQETGRAGRDGLEAECVLFYSYSDVIRWESLLNSNAETPPEVAAAQQLLLKEMQQFCTRKQCRHSAISRYFGQTLEKASCGACDFCRQEVDAVPGSTVIAQKILSAVYRLEQRFGMQHLVEFLKGADTERIRRNGHQQIKTYGALSDLKTRFIQEFCFQLVDQGLLERTGGDLPVLKLNQLSLEVLRGARPVAFQLPEGWSLTTTEVEQASWVGVERGLFEELRRLRKEMAAERNVPAFQLFSDRALRDLARIRPTTREGLKKVHGIGNVKIRNYGPLLLGIIRSYCDGRGLSTDVGIQLAEPKRKPDSVRASRRRHALDLLKRGAALDVVAQSSGLAPSTVTSYLAESVEEGMICSIGPWVDDESCLKILEIVQEVGAERLKPIFDRLGGEVSYDIIRLVVAQVRCRQKERSGLP